MSGSLMRIDNTTSIPTRGLALYPRRDAAVPAEPRGSLKTREGLEEAQAYRTNEFLASDKGVTLPRFKRAFDLYQQNADARRTLFSGPFFIDTYA